MTIKAIETRYKGYRFRSRLEARFAVFLTELGVDFQYEPEGFELAPGEYYLPDFYLPTSECYVEIKPSSTAPTEMDKAGKKLALLCNKANANGCIVSDAHRNNSPGSFFGIESSIFQLPRTLEDQTTDCLKVTREMIEECRWANLFCYEEWETGNIWTPVRAHFTKFCHRKTRECTAPNILIIPPMRERHEYVETLSGYLTQRLDLLLGMSRIVRAQKAAKAARFEHGETPE